MRCPVCGKDLATSSSHKGCVERFPTKFNFLKSKNPTLFALLTKAEQHRSQDITNKANVFVYDKDGVRKLYRHKCVSCGSCCNGHFDITIHEGDVLRWIAEDRQDIFRQIQILPKSIGSCTRFCKGWSDPPTKEELDSISGDELLEGEERFIKENSDYINDLVDFIEDNHVMVNDGKELSQSNILPIPIPHLLLSGAYQRAIFRPRTFDVILEGLKRKILYFFTNELDENRRCSFLTDKNLCAIQQTKPETCRDYPVKSEFESNTKRFDRSLSFCKGFKLINNR